jgi:hypothetical protein
LDAAHPAKEIPESVQAFTSSSPIQKNSKLRLQALVHGLFFPMILPILIFTVLSSLALCCVVAPFLKAQA